MADYSKIIQQLDAMFKIDQAAVLDPQDWQKFQSSPNGQAKHIKKLKQIIRQIGGWPTISKVGPIAYSQAWFIAQHSDHDLAFQKKMLKKLQSLPEGEVNKVNIAMLIDRVSKNQNLPQIYGTQWIVENDRQVPYPIEDPEHVEDRRRQMGLNTMVENQHELEEWSRLATKLRDEKKASE